MCASTFFMAAKAPRGLPTWTLAGPGAELCWRLGALSDQAGHSDWQCLTRSLAVSPSIGSIRDSSRELDSPGASASQVVRRCLASSSRERGQFAVSTTCPWPYILYLLWRLSVDFIWEVGWGGGDGWHISGCVLTLLQGPRLLHLISLWLFPYVLLKPWKQWIQSTGRQRAESCRRGWFQRLESCWLSVRVVSGQLPRAQYQSLFSLFF